MNAEPVPTTRAGLLEILRHELHEVNEELPPDLPSDKELVAELGLDSLDVVELVARLEYRFRFVVPVEDWQRLATLDAIAEYALEQMGR